MKSWVVAQMAEIIAIQTEVEAMIVANYQRKIEGHALAYDEQDFQEKANSLWAISSYIMKYR